MPPACRPVLVLLPTVTAGSDRPSSAAPQTTSVGPSPSATGRPPDRSTDVDIRLTIDGHGVDATLNDSATARDFAALLPLTLRMADFHHTERIADPPRRLDTSGAPEASEPKAGDLAYYAPWGNLAFFYRDGEHSPGLVILGRLDDIGDTGRLASAGRVRVESVS